MAQYTAAELQKRLLQFRYVKGGANGTTPVDDGNPLKKGRWIDSCEEYIGGEDDDLLSLVYDGSILTKDITICSTLEHASDIIHGYHVTRTWDNPAPLIFVRTPDIIAHRLAVSGGTPLPDFTILNLPQKYTVSPPHLKKFSRRLCNLIANTKELEDSRVKVKKLHSQDGLALLRAEYASVSKYMDTKALAAIDFAMEGFLSLGLVEKSR